MGEEKKGIFRNWAIVAVIFVLLNIVIGMICYVVVEAKDMSDIKDVEEILKLISSSGEMTNVSENEVKNDISAPEVYIDGFGDGSICKDSCTVRLSAADDTDGINVRYRCEVLKENGEKSVIEDSTNHVDGNNYNDSRTYSEEGVYEIMFYAYDDNGNASDIKYASFGVDTTAPEVTFEGFDFTKVQNSAVNLTIGIRDIFYEGMTANVQFFRLNGEDMELIQTSEYDIKAVNNKNIYSFEGSGSFIGQVIVYDKAMHETKQEIQFQIDMIPPYVEIDFDGEDYGGEAFLDKIPEVKVRVEEDNYNGSTVNIKLLKKNKNGEYESVGIEGDIVNSKIDGFDNGESYVNKNEHLFMLSDKITEIPVKIKEEGIFELHVSSVDATGNASNECINFTIDSSAPTIGYLSDFNEKYLKSFTLPNDLSNYIDDVTGVNYKAYLNSEETGSGEIKKDGKYILQVVAWDEAFNVSEEMIAFIVDNTKPTVIVNGIGDDGKMDKGTPVTLSLKDSDDYFTDICVNGENIDISGDRRTAQLIPTEYGSYNILVKAKDNAGNITTETITANCEAILAAPDTFSSRKIEVKTISKHGGFMQNPAALWAMCGVICAFAVMLVVVAFSVEMKWEE